MSTTYPFERFTDDAKRVLTLAQQEAEASGHSYIGSEHLLLALLQQPGRARHVLTGLGVNEVEVREKVKTVLGRSERMAINDLIPTTRVKKIIELSFAEAVRMKSESVDSGHLLLGLVVEGGSIGAQVLDDLGATRQKVISALASDFAVPLAPSVDAARYRDVMSGFPAGVVIVTAFADDGSPRGLTVTAFCAVSLSPPLALVCVEKSSNTLPAVLETNGFTANLLAAGREELARLMATKVSDKFGGYTWRRSETNAGGPILADDAVAYAVCTLDRTIEAGDHWILIGTVVDGGHDHDVQPLLYHRRDYKRL